MDVRELDRCSGDFIRHLPVGGAPEVFDMRHMKGCWSTMCLGYLGSTPSMTSIMDTEATTGIGLQGLEKCIMHWSRLAVQTSD